MTEPQNSNPTLISLEQVQQLIRELTNRMLSAPAREVPAIQLELQKLRVAQIVLREVQNNVSDPNAYKEVNLLNRMIKGHEFEDPETAADEDNIKTVTNRLAERGITPESAHRLAKAFASAMKVPSDEDDGEPELIPIDPARVN